MSIALGTGTGTAAPTLARPALTRPTLAQPALPRPDLVGRALVWLGLVLVPWLGVLAASGAWNWVGLDSLEAAGLVVTGLLLRRADPRHCLTAAGTAMLLLTDAWFDVTTAAPGQALALAVAMAVLAELPLAYLCARLALRSLPRA
ncbi:hypothetical protein [Streptacidiphilus carbonis]|uniref:hypothetical protein n=1 Tax=Streptacidiphilus carbonis TaxID=105422 RepID=UPI000A410A1A|nr:hypothetical protein [Streptacidiphilus carbonis]